MKIRWIFTTLVILILLSSCSGPKAAEVKPTALPSPAADKASVTGKMINKSTSQPITKRLIRLAPIFGEGKDAIYVFNETADPGTYTDDNGFFQFIDIKPGSYAILLSDSNGYTMSINKNADEILTINATTGKVTEAGVIAVDLSAPPPSKK